MERLDVLLAEDETTEKDEVLALAALDEVGEGSGLAELNGSTRVPSIDDYDDYDDPYLEAVPAPVNYPNYRRETSFTLSGPIGNANYPGRRFESKEAARAWCIEKYGFIYEERHVPNRWIFVLPKPKQEPQ